MPSPEDRIASLEAAVASLREQLENIRQNPSPSMRAGRCPSCRGDRILHFRKIREQTHGGLVDLSLQQHKRFLGFKPGDPLEAFACRACGLVEWHVTSFDKLEVDGETVVEHVSEPPPPSDDPYR
jgi:hypothetical protein